LFHVNFSDPDRRRTPKSSAHIFSKIITQRDLPSYLLETTGKLPLKTTSSESITELNNSLNNFCTLQHTTANCGRMFFTYSRKFLFIWLATMMYSSCIFRSWKDNRTLSRVLYREYLFFKVLKPRLKKFRVKLLKCVYL